MVKNNNYGRDVFSHVTIGLQLGLTMSIFVYGGYRLDLYFKKSPVFLVIGAALGMVLGFYHLFKNLEMDKNSKMKNLNKENEKRIKWKW